MNPYFRIGDRVRFDKLPGTILTVRDMQACQRSITLGTHLPIIDWWVSTSGAWGASIEHWQSSFSLDSENAEVNFND